MPGKHATLAPSAAHRWTLCTASIEFTRDIPPEPAGNYAIEGTWAHRLAEAALKFEPLTDAEKLKAEADGVDLNELSADVDRYTRFVAEMGGMQLIEQPIDLEPITGEKGARGTADAVVLTPNTITICDLKYGRGVQVDAVENPQLLIYAGGAYNTLKAIHEAQYIKMVIFQPRLNHISTWEITADELEKRLSNIRERARECLTPGAGKFHPDIKACRFCPGAGRCSALAKYALTAAGIEAIHFKHAPMLDTDDLSALLDKLELIRKWAATLEESAHNIAVAGAIIPGYKLVAGRKGPRKWTGDDAADTLLKKAKIPADDRYIKNVITPTAAEKLYKKGRINPDTWEELEKITYRAPAKPVLVPGDDPRPVWVGMDESDFPDESKK